MRTTRIDCPSVIRDTDHARVRPALRLLLSPAPILGYWLLFVVYSFAYLFEHPNVAAFIPLATVFTIIPVLDLVVGTDRSNFPPKLERWASTSTYPRLFPVLLAPVQLLVLFQAAHFFASTPLLDIHGKAGWILSSGVVLGFLGNTAAHELIHRRTRLERGLGGVLLASVCCGPFKIEHIRGHHVDVATPDDPSSARYDEALYYFLARAIPGNWRKAWRLETTRLAQAGHSPWGWRNEVLQWNALSVAICAVLGTLYGPLASLFFLLQSAIASSLLEAANYVEHYGLSRTPTTRGRFEKVTLHHSWDSAYLLSSLFLFQLPRHADHHVRPARGYAGLRHHPDSPQLPAGYPAMVLLALVPPLWRRVMNPRVRRALARAHARQNGSVIPRDEAAETSRPRSRDRTHG